MLSVIKSILQRYSKSIILIEMVQRMYHLFSFFVALTSNTQKKMWQLWHQLRDTEVKCGSKI